MADFTLTTTVFTIISGLIEERAGVHHAPTDRELLAGKVAAQAQELGFATPLDYYYFLRYDDVDHAQLDRLVESVLVHETYFFREVGALRVLVDEIVLPRVGRGNGKPVLWSAACSTGEEPLTLAMLLAERGVLDGVRLVASDISAEALARAQRGVFARRAVRTEVLPACARAFLKKSDDDAGWRVDRRLIDAVEWRRVNLLDAGAVARLPTADAIACRNLLFYFRDDVARAAVTHVAGRLAPDGALVVGVAESLLRLGTSLACEEHAGAFLYRHPRAAASSTTAGAGAASSTIGGAAAANDEPAPGLTPDGGT